LNYLGQTPIRIELGLFECSAWYAQTPINFMSDQELVNSGFNIDTRYQSQVKNLRSTENEYGYYDRSKETMKKLIRLHRKTGGTVLLVAHAPSLEVLTRHLMNGQPRPAQLLDLAGRVGYCSMTIVDANPASNSWQFRYSLDESANRQQQLAEQSKNMLARTTSMSYQPIALSSSYALPATASQFQYFA
jgi:phosphohistidine phosphatase SixA